MPVIKGQYFITTSIGLPFNKGRETDLRHSSVFGKPVYIRIAPPRYQCTNCEGNPTTTQRSLFTLSYENRILISLINSTAEDAALKEGSGYGRPQTPRKHKNGLGTN
ncbi:hypothetical protein DENIS_1810 [Desulfonema ishimotonii]|uniref:Uncharacterized protein n=1 Tax=Desulfonema ishimotonii TaxID=45657 RepID=A0A401FV59_9BACT|nr:hypothetical protein DENIS_1810 [Desulfonema ishimotonii]